MGRIEDELRREICKATDITALIREDIKLKKDGANLKGLCPFHHEKSPSFNVNPSENFFHCFGCKKSGDAVSWLIDHRGMEYRDAIDMLAKKAGIPVPGDDNPFPQPKRKAAKKSAPARKSNPPPPEALLEDIEEEVMPWDRPRRRGPAKQAFSWERCVKRMDDVQIARMVTERGYRRDFVEFLVDHKMVGIYNKGFAFPVHDGGEVVRCHYRTENGWAYSGSGKSVPWVFGDIENAPHITVHESQWDALAMADSLCWDEDPRELAFIVTRGATAKCDMSEFRVPRLIAIPQNDPDTKRNTKGLTPAEEWLEAVSKSRAEGTALVVGKIPEGIKDLNDWTRDKQAGPKDVRRRLIDEAMSPFLESLKRARDMRKLAQEPDDPNCMIGTGDRFLCKGGSALFIGPAGIGKSTLIASITTHWAAGVPWQGINVRRPLTILVIQAENDDRDTAEMTEAAFKALEADKTLTKEQIKKAEFNLIFVTETEKTGRDWAEWLETLIRETGADLVVADPLLSFFGDDISNQKACSIFLRNQIQPVLHRTGAMLIFVHHTGKTSADAKSRSHWAASDYSYIGIGSSELTNWPRAIMAILPAGPEGIFKLMLTKRGKRAQMTSGFQEGFVTNIHLAHSTNGGLGWTEVEEPEPDDDDDPGPRRRSRKKQGAKGEGQSAESEGMSKFRKAQKNQERLRERAVAACPKVNEGVSEAVMRHNLIASGLVDSASASKTIQYLVQTKNIVPRGNLYVREK